MTAGPSFSDIVTASSKGCIAANWDEVVLSQALPLKGVDPLKQLPSLSEEEKFRFLWDVDPGLCFAASGKCQSLELVGPRRFELAQRFSDVTLSRLTDVTPEAPEQARPKILLAFTFFEQPGERKYLSGISPGVQAVLPRWQLTRQGSSSWLRVNGVVTNQADARELSEELWLMREHLLKASESSRPAWTQIVSGVSAPKKWQECYKPALSRGIELVNDGGLAKLVLAVRKSIWLPSSLDPLAILSRLRTQQAGSCRFLWQRSQKDSFFGASPERLLSLRRGQIQIDALAGTATRDDDGQDLLKSDKDRREHELVVSSINDQLLSQGLKPCRSRCPRLARHGHLVHLHTPITASIKGQSALQLADLLHPTPAVAGLPRREAMSWLRTLEPFERGNYAAPIGWIDCAGDAEFRVAIRCGHIRGNQLDLTAGAGLVRGSIAEKELQEVGLKLAVLANQFDLKAHDQLRIANK